MKKVLAVAVILMAGVLIAPKAATTPRKTSIKAPQNVLISKHAGIAHVSGEWYGFKGMPSIDISSAEKGVIVYNVSFYPAPNTYASGRFDFSVQYNMESPGKFALHVTGMEGVSASRASRPLHETIIFERQ